MLTTITISNSNNAAIIAALITGLVAILATLTKDYWFPILIENRNSRIKSEQTFKKYGHPLMLSSIQLLVRIKEIFERGYFLLDKTPKNQFNEYKYISSLYRLLALIGWIRASKIELSHIEVQKNDDYQKINDAIEEFEKSLADGQHIEQQVFENLSKKWVLKDSTPPEEKKKLGILVERIVDEYCFNENVEIPIFLSDEKKRVLAKKVCDSICEHISIAPIDETIINESVNFTIKEMSRIEAWIFRDWQSALGDLMIKKSSSDVERKFEVIGFKEFENIYYSQIPEEKKWIGRINRLLKNLDVSVEDRFDARTQQIVNIYKATYNLLNAYSKVKTSEIDIVTDKLVELDPSLYTWCK
jgi:hypothetical protein